MTKKWLSFALKFGVSAVLIWFMSLEGAGVVESETGRSQHTKNYP